MDYLRVKYAGDLPGKRQLLVYYFLQLGLIKIPSSEVL